MRAWLGALVLGAWVSLAQAQSEYDRELAQALSAHAAGDLGKARQHMERAHELEPNARTLRGLGVIAFAQERYLQAVGPLEESLRSTALPLTPELRAAVEELLQRIWTRIGRLRLVLDPADSQVRVDGAAPVASTTGDLLLLPGKRLVEVSAEGRVPYGLELTVLPGASETVHIRLAPASMAPRSEPSVRVLAAADYAVDQRLARYTPRLRNAVLSSAAVLTLTGVALSISAFRKFEAVDRACRDLGGCSRDEASRRLEHARVEPLWRAGVALGAIGVVGLGTALSLELAKRRGRSSLGLGARALHWRFRF